MQAEELAAGRASIPTHPSLPRDRPAVQFRNVCHRSRSPAVAPIGTHGWAMRLPPTANTETAARSSGRLASGRLFVVTRHALASGAPALDPQVETPGQKQHGRQGQGNDRRAAARATVSRACSIQRRRDRDEPARPFESLTVRWSGRRRGLGDGTVDDLKTLFFAFDSSGVLGAPAISAVSLSARAVDVLRVGQVASAAPVSPIPVPAGLPPFALDLTSFGQVRRRPR